MMAKSSWNIVKAFLLFHIVLAGVKANELYAPSSGPSELNVTSSLEDYIAQVERQYLSQIASDDALVAEFRAGYERQLSTVDAQRIFSEAELLAVDQKLYPLEFLNELSKHCVQKYRGLLYAVSTLRQNFASCINQGRGSLNSILSSCDSNIRSLNNLYNSNFKSGIADCKRKNINSYANQTACVLDSIYRISVSFNSMQRSFQTNLDTARCSADTRIRQTAECAFRVLNATISSVGATTTLIDNCIAGLESCEPCEDQNNNNNHNNNTAIIVPEPQCSNVINVIQGADLYRNDTIRNPFVGLNSTLDCILINFLRPN